MDTRESLIAAALEVLEEGGEATFSTRAVLDIAKVSAPTLYHHFGNADGILSAALAAAFAHVVNVVEAVQRALEYGQGGRVYFIRDQEVKTFREFIELIANTQGVSIDGLRSMPYWLAFTIGRFMEIFAALTFKKGDPPLSRSLVRMIGREFTVNDSAARRDLGYVGEMTRGAGRQMYLDAIEAAKSHG